MTPCSKRAQGFSTYFWVMMVLYCTTLLHTCLSTSSSLLHCPFVLLSCWLVIACCIIASVACIFAACPSFDWLLCSFPSLASSHRHHQREPSLPYALSQTRHVLHPTPLCAGWLLHYTLPLLLASLPLLCPCQRPSCTGIIAVVALASLPLFPLTLPLSIAAVKQIFAMHPSFG